jgi:hypothetical protein
MIWYVHYKTGGVVGLHTVSTLPAAFKWACYLLDRGSDVSQIEGSGGLRGMSADEIKRTYAELKVKKALQ